MGSARFTVAALGLLINPRTYKGRLSVLETSPAKDAAGSKQQPEQEENNSGGADSGYKVTTEGRLRDNLLENISGDGWKTIEGDFSLFVAANVTHISTTTLIAPKARWDDGAVDVIITTNGSRGALLSTMLGVDDGSYITKTEGVQYFKAQAFQIEPLEKAGLFSLDGERTEYTPLRCQVHRGLLNLVG